ncbi:MAG: LamG-like jellyroll fold domain-containing protein [Verrucomicrobiota bacterium]
MATNGTDGVGSDTALNTDPISFSIEGPQYASSVRFDDLAFWNRALTTEEIAYLYNNGAGNTVSDLNEIPAAPVGLTATGTTEAVILAWAPPSDVDVVSYDVLRGAVSGGPYEVVARVEETGAVDLGLTNGVTYFYVVRSVDLVGKISASSAEVSAVPDADTNAPAAPTGFVAGAGFARAYLNWSAGADPDIASYNVYRSTSVGGPFALIDSAGAQLDYIDEGLANGFTYHYRITAVDIAGNESDPAQTNVMPFANQDVATGLVGYWPLDAASGTNLMDMTSHTNDGHFSSGSPDWVVGKFGNALQFVEADGESAFINGLPVYRSSNAFTLAFWINQDDGYRNRPIESGDIRIHDFRFAFGDLWPSVDLSFQNDRTWHHVACSFDLADPVHGKKLYVDGVLVASHVAYIADVVLDSSWIRLSTDHGGYRWGGMLDDVAVWNRALSLDEIESLVLVHGGAGRAVQDVVQTPPIAFPQNVSTNEDFALPITLTGGDGQGHPLTFSLVDAPTNGWLTGTPPNLVYTPTQDFFGNDSFTFTVNDGFDGGNTARVELIVHPVNDAPVADPQNLIVDEDTPLALTLTGSDIDVDALTFAVSVGPTNGMLSGAAPALTYRPDSNFYGVDSFTFVAHDGALDSLEATVTITVNSVNDAPVAHPLGVYTLQDAGVLIRLGGSDNDQDPLTFIVQSPPTNGSLSGVAPDVTYTPAPGTFGTDTFTYVANDGIVDSPTASVTILVYPLSEAKSLLAHGLVGYWPMDNTTGSEVTDETVQQNHGAFVEGTPGWVSGKFGNALDLVNFRDDRAEIPHIPEFNQGGAFSISFWIYAIDCYRDLGVFNKGQRDIGMGASNREMRWQHFGEPWSSGASVLGFESNDQTWRHLVVVYDPRAVWSKQVFVDSVLVGSNTVDTTSPSDVLNSNPISFNNAGDQYKSIVRFDDVAYWDRPLTTTEIDYIHNGGMGNTVSLLNEIPSAPDGVAAVPTTASVLLSWNLSDDDIVSSEVYRAAAPGGPFALLVSTSAMAYADTGLTNGTTYYYTLRCTDLRGAQSSDSAVIAATPSGDITPPAAPTQLAADGGFGRVYLRWELGPEPDLAGYTISRSEAPGGPFTELVSGLMSSAYVDEVLTNGVTYYYEVNSEDLAGNVSSTSTISTAPYELQNVTDGLVGYWPLDATGGTTLFDRTENTNHGLVASGTPDWLPGKFSNAMNFVEAEQEEARIDPIPAYRGTGKYTIAMWVNQKHGSGNRFFSSGSIVFNNYQLTSFGEPWSNTPLGFTNDEIWHHVALTFDSDDPVAGKKLYVDGMLLATNGGFIGDSTLNNAAMLLSINHGGYRWGGLIDDLAVWNRALTVDQIESLVLANGGAGRSVLPPGLNFDLGLEKTASSTNLWDGTNLTYTITVTNTGPDIASNVTVADMLPPGLVPLGEIPPADDVVYPMLTFHLGDLAPRTMTTIVIHVALTSTVAGVLTNEVMVQSVEPEFILTNNHAFAITTVADADGDGLINPLDLDDDNDGLNDEDETYADTDPLDPNSMLMMHSVSINGPNLMIRWQGGVMATQYLERSFSLMSNGPWTVIHTNLPPTPVSNMVIDLGGSAGSRAYYRIRIP